MPDAPPQRGLEYIVSWTEGLSPEKTGIRNEDAGKKI